MNRIALTNLGKYNEGSLIYKWLDLPFTNEELENTLNEIGINEEYEEYFISDYETDFDYKIGEYENIDTLNELFETIENLDTEEFNLFFKAYTNLFDNNIDNAIEKFQNGDYRVYTDCNDMSDVAYQYIEETGMLNEIPDNIARYFDYESFGRDMNIEGSFYQVDYDTIVEIY